MDEASSTNQCKLQFALKTIKELLFFMLILLPIVLMITYVFDIFRAKFSSTLLI